MDHKDDYIEKAILPALVLTMISFFNGGVLYGTPLPIWTQLLRNVIIYWVVLGGTNFLAGLGASGEFGETGGGISKTSHKKEERPAGAPPNLCPFRRYQDPDQAPGGVAEIVIPGGEPVVLAAHHRI